MAKNISNLNESLDNRYSPKTHTHTGVVTSADYTDGTSINIDGADYSTQIGTLSSLQTSNKDNLVAAINELFQNANSGKTTIANAIGSPLSSSQTFSAMGTSINNLMASLRTNLQNKGVTVSSSDKLQALVNKVADISTGIELPETNYPTWAIESSLNNFINGLSSTDLWATCANMPTARKNHRAEGINGKFYVVGGIIDNNWTRTGKTECFDPVTNTWSTKATCPLASYGGGSGVYNNKMYYIGGNSGNADDSNYCYDPSTNTWTSKAYMPDGKYLVGSTSNDKYIFITHGLSYNSSGAEVNSNLCYDASTNTWTTKATIGNARRSPAVSYIDSTGIYVIGGYRGSSSAKVKTVHKYTISSNSVTTGTSVSTAIAYFDAAHCNGKIYAIGGQTTAAVNTVQIFNGSSWSTGTAAPFTVCNAPVASTNGMIFYCGGENYNGDSSPQTSAAVFFPKN